MRRTPRSLGAALAAAVVAGHLLCAAGPALADPALVVTSVLVGAPVLAAAPDPAETATVAALAATVANDQVQVVTRDFGVPVTRAQQAVASDQAALADAQAALTTDSAASASDAATVSAMTTTLGNDTADLAMAVDAHRRAEATLTADRDRLRAIAVALYIGPPNGVAGGTADVAAAQQAEAAEASLAIAEQTVGADVHDDLARSTTTGVRQTRLTGQVAADTATLASDTQRAASAAAAVVADQAVLAARQQAVSTDQATLVAAQQAQTSAVAAVAAPALTAATAASTASPVGLSAIGPTILGPSVLTAAQLSGWFAQAGYQALTSATIDQLIGWYLADGAVEGVRGDVAFAQAVLETGGFASTDAVTINNYAGVGHCDSCATGLPFPGPEAGVIGQLQLLRTFADATTTVDGLPQPLANAALAPGAQSRRGCCTTWPSLTGVWATDPGYGQKILTIYSRMLAYALATPPVAP